MEKINSWKDLTLREKIGQTVICLCETEKHIEMCGSIENFIKKYPVGGIFNNGGLVKGLLVGANDRFREITEEYSKYSRVPLFGVADGGSFAKKHGIALPPQMALGVTEDEKLAYKAGHFSAENYKKTGIHWGFWPCCDIGMSTHSPVLDTRCISDNADINYKIAKAEIDAMKDNGVIATIKHYPGADWKEYIDSHLTPCDNTTPMEVWRATYGKMYKQLIDAGVPAIMTAHINLVDYQKENTDGVYPPATLSYELTTTLLREELGFKGVTVTDALVMGGFTGENAVENTIKSFLSGNDVLLWPTYEYIDEMEKRILSGEIDESILDAAVERIWNMKKEYGLLDNKPLTSDKDVDFYENIVEEICDNCITLINNYNKILPLSQKDIRNILIVGVTPDDGQYESFQNLKNEFEKYGCNVHLQRNIWVDEVYEKSDNYDLILFALCRTPHCPIGPIDFWGEEATSIWASNSSEKAKTVVASFGSPYLYRYYKNSKTTYINAYSNSGYIISSFVKALFGEKEFIKGSKIKLVD